MIYDSEIIYLPPVDIIVFKKIMVFNILGKEMSQVHFGVRIFTDLTNVPSSLEVITHPLMSGQS